METLLIVEDDRAQSAVLASMASSSVHAARLAVRHVPDVRGLERYLEEGGRLDILMMDIHLGDGVPNGIEAVRRLVPVGGSVQVVYVSGHVEFCTAVYQTDHVYFLVKPVRQQDFDDAIAKALRNLESIRARPLVVRSRGDVMLVVPQEISYLESRGRKVLVHTGRAVLQEYASIERLAAQLPASFVRCHKSFLANMDHVAELRADRLLLVSGEEVPVSQKRRKQVREQLLAHVARHR